MGRGQGRSFELVSHLLPSYPRFTRSHLFTCTPFPQLLHLENKGGTPPSPAPFLYLGLTFSWERSLKSEKPWKSETTCGPSIPVWALPCFVWLLDMMGPSEGLVTALCLLASLGSGGRDNRRVHPGTVKSRPDKQQIIISLHQSNLKINTGLLVLPPCLYPSSLHVCV